MVVQTHSPPLTSPQRQRCAMAHLDVLNPLHRLRQLGRMWIRKSKSLVKRTGKSVPAVTLVPRDVLESVSPIPEPAQAEDAQVASQKTVPVQETLEHDSHYYEEDNAGQLCVFRVDGVLFRVSASISRRKVWTQRSPSLGATLLSHPGALRLRGYV